MTPTSAHLFYDSESAGAILGARGACNSTRTLVFQAGSLSIDILVYDGGDDLRILHGQVVDALRGHPLAGARVQSGTDWIETDEHGQFFTTGRKGRGAERFLVHTDDIAVVCSIPARESAPTP